MLTLFKVYVQLAKPVYLAYGLVCVSYHWNNFLWPLLVAFLLFQRQFVQSFLRAGIR